MKQGHHVHSHLRLFLASCKKSSSLGRFRSISSASHLYENLGKRESAMPTTKLTASTSPVEVSRSPRCWTCFGCVCVFFVSTKAFHDLVWSKKTASSSLLQPWPWSFSGTDVLMCVHSALLTTPTSFVVVRYLYIFVPFSTNMRKCKKQPPPLPFSPTHMHILCIVNQFSATQHQVTLTFELPSKAKYQSTMTAALRAGGSGHYDQNDRTITAHTV